MLASDHDEQKNKAFKQNISLKINCYWIKWYEAGKSDATSTEVWSQNSDEGSGFKAKIRCLAHSWFQ